MAGAAVYTSIDGHRRLARNFMTVVGKLEATVANTLDVAFDRAGAALWRIRGAAVASKLRVVREAAFCARGACQSGSARSLSTMYSSRLPTIKRNLRWVNMCLLDAAVNLMLPPRCR